MGERAVIHPKTQNIIIVSKYLDEITFPEELCEVLQEEYGIQNQGKASVKSMGKTRGTSQIALVCLRAKDTKAALIWGKVTNIIKAYFLIPPCFRCFNLGHMARNCSNPTDTLFARVVELYDT